MRNLTRLLGLALLLAALAACNSTPSGNTTSTPTAFQGNTPITIPSTTATATSSVTIFEHRPVCDSPGQWSSPTLSAVQFTCDPTGLEMAQVSQTNYAEFDLSSSYDTSNFGVNVSVAFPNPSDCRTYAAVIFNSPLHTPGGYIAGITACGSWRLQQVVSGHMIPQIAQGSYTTKSDNNATMAITVRGFEMQLIINGQTVSTQTISPQGPQQIVGLMVELDNAQPSSTIVFYDFRLNSPDEQ